MKAFVNGVLKRIFEPKSDKVVECWRKMRNENLKKFYSSPNAIRVDQVEENEMGTTCSTQGLKGMYVCMCKGWA
jgi:hypothetical protein